MRFSAHLRLILRILGGGAILGAIAWFYTDRSWEPALAILGGTVALLGSFLSDGHTSSTSAPEDSVPPLLTWLRRNVLQKSLSSTLPYAIRLAQKLGDAEFEKWARLELNGYYRENGMLDSDIVPEYRTVTGQHTDEYGRPLLLQDSKLSFINETSLRNSVKELEDLSSSRKTVVMRDLHARQLIKEHFGVDVTRFEFSTIAVSGVLNNIHNRLFDKLSQLHDS